MPKHRAGRIIVVFRTNPRHDCRRVDVVVVVVGTYVDRPGEDGANYEFTEYYNIFDSARRLFSYAISFRARGPQTREYPSKPGGILEHGSELFCYSLETEIGTLNIFTRSLDTVFFFFDFPSVDVEN